MNRKHGWLLAALACAPAAPAWAAPLVAVVEAVQMGRPDVEELDTLQEGEVVALGGGDRIVLSYLDSCNREVITGPGLVRVGSLVSTLEGATLEERKALPCRAKPSGELGSGTGGAVRLRGIRPALQPPSPEQQLESFRKMREQNSSGRAVHANPVMLLEDPSSEVLLQPLDGQGEVRRLQAKVALVDTQDLTPPLEAGKWLARRGSVALRFEVPQRSPTMTASRPARLLRYN